MNEAPYKNREIDEKFQNLHERFDEQDIVLKKIETNQNYTNGKVKKIILTIAVLGGLLAGITGKEIVMPLLLKMI